MRQIVVGMGDIKIGVGDVELVTYALGSCVGICLYDEVTKVGGMLHAMLPQMGSHDLENNPMRYVKSGINILFRKVCESGADRRRLKAKIVGGAKMFEFAMSNSNMNIGMANVIVSKRELMNLGIPIVAEMTGGTVGRTVWFVPSDGKTTIKTTENQTMII